eukprot:Nitzschia sp. Nitz4//scaffold159_size51929//48287//49103//NITZ4_006888-RA/size51929-augustus-gene-0.82-mRNA-1//-1//CDS//3329537601//7807//frame0
MDPATSFFISSPPPGFNVPSIMVFYYTSLCGNYVIYMGRDQHENEELIKYGQPEDVWFHVDNLSSAHVYLRMKPGMTLDDITEDLLLQCSTLVKANSIQGCKKADVPVVYTRWKNLKKTPGSADGQVGFHRPENVRRLPKVEKNNPVVKQLEKTREERFPDLYQEQQKRLAEIQRQKKNHYKQLQKEKQQRKLEAELEKQARSYDRLFTGENMTSVSQQKATVDSSAAEEYEDDFF